MKKVFGLIALLALLSMGFAQEATEAAATSSAVRDGMLAIGAALSIGISALAVGWAMASIGSAGAGTLAERPQAFGQILIYLVIPETLIIFGFVIAFFLQGYIGG